MPDWFLNMPHVLQAMLATVFTWAMTAAGAAMVFCFRRVSRTALDGMMSFSGGVMLAASFYSLLLPAMEMAETLQMNSALTISLGFLLGGAFMLLCDGMCACKLQGMNDIGRRRTMLMTSITMHNIPEGLAIGVAFGALDYGLPGAELAAACMLAMGIAFQNLPEGLAVSAPLLRDGASKSKAFFMGQLSGIVEIFAGALGAMLVLRVRMLLPALLAFAAGAMVYVAAAELIPESRKNMRKTLISLCFLLGFVVMMALDMALG